MKSKFLTRSMATLLAMAMVLTGSVAYSGQGNVAEAAKKPVLSAKTINVVVGKKATLKVKNAKKGKITFVSKNKKVAKVTKAGKISGIKKGKTKVIVTVKNGSKKTKLTCSVNVVIGAKKLTITKKGASKKVSSATIKVGQSLKLAAKRTPSKSNDVITWSTSKKAVAKVSTKGVVKGLKIGTAVITAKSVSKKKATIKITVKAKISGESLKAAYASYFKIGTAIRNDQLTDSDTMAAVTKQFNSLTMENEMKPEAILGNTAKLVATSESEFEAPESYQETQVPKLNFTTVDKCVAAAKAAGIKMRGHVLVWHSQTPEWFFRTGYVKSGAIVSKDVMNARMEWYIKQVVKHIETKYPDTVYAWDVVNEMFKNDGGGLRETYTSNGWFSSGSMWTKIYGSDIFAVNAFAYARKYCDPDVKLFINDYNEYMPEKTDDIVKIANKIKAQGNIDGIGMQMHLDVNFPSAQEVETAVDKFASTGLEIQMTEFDITASSSEEEAQAKLYADIFKMLIAKKKAGVKITSVTFWGFYDEMSWRASQNPLIFLQDSDTVFAPKQAYFDIINAAINS